MLPTKAPENFPKDAISTSPPVSSATIGSLRMVRLAARPDMPKKIGMKNAEIMEVYKKYGVNPAGGCLPMFLPIPFLFAFYKVLSLAIDLRGAEWFWVSDLSQPETIAIRVLPLLMLGTQFWLQKMTPTASMDPNQAKMMMFMPLMMGFFFYGASSGLVLYWLTTNVVGIVQQYFFNKAAQAPAASTTIDVNNNKKKGKK